MQIIATQRKDLANNEAKSTENIELRKRLIEFEKNIKKNKFTRKDLKF